MCKISEKKSYGLPVVEFFPAFARLSRTKFVRAIFGSGYTRPNGQVFVKQMRWKNLREKTDGVWGEFRDFHLFRENYYVIFLMYK